MRPIAVIVQVPGLCSAVPPLGTSSPRIAKPVTPHPPSVGAFNRLFMRMAWLLAASVACMAHAAACPSPARDHLVAAMKATGRFDFALQSNALALTIRKTPPGERVPGHWVHVTDGHDRDGALAWVPCVGATLWAEAPGGFQHWVARPGVPGDGPSVGIEALAAHGGTVEEWMTQYWVRGDRIHSVFEFSTWHSSAFEKLTTSGTVSSGRNPRQIKAITSVADASSDRVLRRTVQYFCWHEGGPEPGWKPCTRRGQPHPTR